MPSISFQLSPAGGSAVLQRCEHSDVNQKRFPKAKGEIIIRGNGERNPHQDPGDGKLILSYPPSLGESCPDEQNPSRGRKNIPAASIFSLYYSQGKTLKSKCLHRKNADSHTCRLHRDQSIDYNYNFFEEIFFQVQTFSPNSF